jgi:hypothetical protein
VLIVEKRIFKSNEALEELKAGQTNLNLTEETLHDGLYLFPTD